MKHTNKTNNNKYLYNKNAYVIQYDNERATKRRRTTTESLEILNKSIKLIYNGKWMDTNASSYKVASDTRADPTAEVLIKIHFD